MSYPAQPYNSKLTRYANGDANLSEVAFVDLTDGDNDTAELGSTLHKYETVAAAIADGAKQLVLGPGTFEYVGTTFAAYVRAVSPGQSTLQITKTGQVGDTGATGPDAEEGSNESGGTGGTGGQGESLAADIDIASDHSVTIIVAFAGGAGGAGGPGGQGDGGGAQGDTGDSGGQGLVNGTILLTGCSVGALSASVADQLSVIIKHSNVTTDYPELITSFANSTINGTNPEIEATVTTANSTYLRTAFGGTVTGPVRSSGSNGVVGLPTLTEAQRIAQSGKTNGDTWIDSATGCTASRKNGVDRLSIAGEALADYLRHFDYARRFKSVDTFTAGTQIISFVANGGAVANGNNSSGRVARTGSNANATARLVYLGSGTFGATQGYHIEQEVLSSTLPFGKPLYLFFRLNWQINISNGIGNTNYTRVYMGSNGGATSTLLDRRGVGIHVNNLREVILVAHNGTVLTQSAPLEVIPSSSTGYTIYSDGVGNVSLFRNTTVIGSISGGPTSNGTDGSAPFAWESGSGATPFDQSVNVTDFTYGFLP